MTKNRVPASDGGDTIFEDTKLTAEEFIATLNNAGANIEYQWQINHLVFTPELEEIVICHIVDLDDIGLADTLIRRSAKFSKRIDAAKLVKLYEKWESVRTESEFLSAVLQCLSKKPSLELGKWASKKIIDRDGGGHRYFMADLIARALPEQDSTPILMDFYQEMPFAATGALGIKGGEMAREFLTSKTLTADKDLQKEILKSIGKINKRLGIPK